MATDLLTKKEVSEKLRVSERTIDKYREKGLLVACKIGSKVLFSKTRIEEVIKKGESR